MWRRPVFITTTVVVFVALIASAVAFVSTRGASADTTTYDITTLAGKVASLNGTAGLQIRFSAFIEQEADETDATAPYGPAITPTNVLSSPLDGTTVGAPDVTVNQDTAAAPQNETAIAVDPNNPNRVVASANDYVTRTWSCTLPGGTPCSARGDGYSGTYFSNDGGATWCCASGPSPANQGTLIPGVDHLSGGQYDAGGDPALAFDSRGNVYYAGLGFDRTASPNTVAVNRGTFPGGHLTWSQPTFINPTTSPAVFNDKEWIGADHYASSPFRDRVYVSFTRFIFNPQTGAYVESPIMVAFSSDGGATFSAPQAVSANAHYGQGSRVVVGPDGTVYIFWEGSTRFGPSTTDVVKSTDGGVTWSKPVAIAQVEDVVPLKNTAFRVNSFPAADINPVNGTLYAAWSSQTDDHTGGLCASNTTAGCHSATFYATSTDGGSTWSAPALIFPGLDSHTRTAVGPYPVTQPNPCVVNGTPTPCPALTPNVRRVDTLWPSVAVSPDGTHVYLSAYAADVVSPWQTCAKTATPTAVGRVNCLALGNYVNNARLDYAVRDVATHSAETIVSTHPINTRVQFGGGFIGDYTDIAVGSDNAYHALWTDTNNKQSVTWWYGFQFVPTTINQEDVVTASGNI